MTSEPEDNRHELGEVFGELDQDVIRLHAHWKIFRQLYGTSPERIEILNAAAPVYARFTQDALLDNITLCITRLTDRAESGKDRSNLTFDRLLMESFIANDAHILTRLKEILKGIKVNAGPLREHRNKRIAHSDLDRALSVEELPGFSRKTIEDILAKIREFMNCINITYLKSTTAYELPSFLGAGDELLWCLKMGLRAKDLTLRLLRGVITDDEAIAEIRSLNLRTLESESEAE